MNTEQRENELSNLIKSYREANPNDRSIPRRLKTKGQYTKKALEFNRRLLREKKTLTYLEPNKVFDPKSNKLVEKLEQTTIQSRIIEEDNLNNRSNRVYYKALRKEVAEKKLEGGDFDIVIDLTKMNFKSVIGFVEDNKQGYKVVARPSGRQEYISFSASNLNRLRDYDILSGGNFVERVGSDTTFMIDINNVGTIEIQFIKDVSNKKNKSNKKLKGGFWKYYNNLPNVDLSRYGIYNHAPKDYKNNCLYIALEEGGLEIDKLNKFKTIVCSMEVPLTRLKKVCSELEINIVLRRWKYYEDYERVEEKVYGIDIHPKFYIGLIDDHYFLVEKTKYTSFSIKRYDDLVGVDRWNEVCKIRLEKNKMRYCREKARKINSFDLIKLMWKLRKTHLRPIPYDDLVKSQFYSKVIENDNLDYDEAQDLKTNEVKQKDEEYYRIYFDSETITEGEKHTPYLICSLTEDGESREFDSIDCGSMFIKDYLRGKFRDYEPIEGVKKYDRGKVKDVLLIAHNFRYDFTFIMDYIDCPNPIFKGQRVMGGSGRIYISKNKFIKLTFQDSCNLIPTRLCAFSKMFDLPTIKEVMPYSVYTEENVDKEWIHIDEIYEHIAEEDKEDFYNNCIRWRCISKDMVNIIDYSREYCKIDCKLLKEGYEAFRTSIMNITNLDIVNYCSIASIGLDFVIATECLGGCYALSGRPQEFIQKCVVGGRTMCRDNKKWLLDRTSGSKVPYDATSLYPSAMERMRGFLRGKPKVIENKNFDWLLKNTSGFFVKCVCKKNPSIRRHFPLLSVMDEGIRDFTNNLEGKIVYLDRVSYEDCVKYQGIEFDILCGYYYDDGYNTNIKEEIRNLFDNRLIAKSGKVLYDGVEKNYSVEDILGGIRDKEIYEEKEKGVEVEEVCNPIQEVYKLLMNSCYGKALLKPIEDEVKVISRKDRNKYLSRNYNFIKSVVDTDRYAIFKEQKTINKHFNNVYAGVEILSMSKRIMNEVMCLCEDMKIPIYYQDTDSLHLDESRLGDLENKFYEVNGRKLVGKNLGEFHIDFEWKGHKNIKCYDCVFLGKKSYLEVYEGECEKSKTIGSKDHIRMKGVSEKSILYYCDKKRKSVLDTYKDLFLGDTIKFDLLCGGNAIKFKYEGNMNVRSLGYYKKEEGKKIKCKYDEEDYEEGIVYSEFARGVKFKKEVGELIHY